MTHWDKATVAEQTKPWTGAKPAQAMLNHIYTEHSILKGVTDLKMVAKHSWSKLFINTILSSINTHAFWTKYILFYLRQGLL